MFLAKWLAHGEKTLKLQQEYFLKGTLKEQIPKHIFGTEIQGGSSPGEPRLIWFEFDLGCSTILPSCSASSANFPSAQAEPGRGWNSQNLSQPNRGSPGDWSPLVPFKISKHYQVFNIKYLSPTHKKNELNQPVWEWDKISPSLLRQQLLCAVTLLGTLEARGAVLGDDRQALPLGELPQLLLPHVHERPNDDDGDIILPQLTKWVAEIANLGNVASHFSLALW